MSQSPGRHDLPETPFDETTDLVDARPAPEQRETSLRNPGWKPLVFIVAMVLSPLFGLVFGLDFALGVLAVALALTTWLAWSGAADLSPEQADRVRKAAILNGALAIGAVVVLVLRNVG